MSPIDETHDPELKTWIESARGHAEFPVQNLPLGVFSTPGTPPRGGVAIGEEILDLGLLARSGLLQDEARDAADLGAQATLNALLEAPPAVRRALRRRISALLCDNGYQAAVSGLLTPAADSSLHLPCAIGDYTDFYAGIEHATNVGRLFRPDSPLLPNYKWVPIGYHGRASSVHASGLPVVRPNGQRKAPDAEAPDFGPCRRLDHELELAVWIGAGNRPGQPVPIAEAAQHVAGLGLLNDWSARDLQAWEYQPLGPFLAKSFHTTVSPWIVTAEALAPFRIPQPARPEGDPRPLPYLWDDQDQAGGAYSITLEALLTTEQSRRQGLAPHRLSQGEASNMYWTIAQMVAHHASNGCNLNPGDLLGTGTISAPEEGGFGSLLEITRGGAQVITLATGEQRSFLNDGDEIILAAHAHAPGRVSIGFGPCRAVVTPAYPMP